MKIEIKRDGLTLKGELLKPDVDKCPVAIIFHGLMSNIGKADNHMFARIAHSLYERGIASVRFDFSGHGESDGKFSDMTVIGEILDAVKILEYTKSLPFAEEIYIVGHSQGGLVGGMIAGYYRDIIDKLVLLAPAATIKTQAIEGSCFGMMYDNYYVPESITMYNVEKKRFDLGEAYYRIAKTLPIFETTSMFKGETLIIHGEKDPAVNYIASIQYGECMPNAEVHILEGENHGLSEFSLDQTIERISDFLAAPKKRPYDGVIFDIDGTLWDARKAVTDSWNEELKANGYDANLDYVELGKLFGKTMQEIFDIIFPDMSTEERERIIPLLYSAQYEYIENNPPSLYRGVKETLEYLKQHYKLYIVTNAQKGYIEALFNATGIGEYFTDALCYGDTGTAKGETIRTICEKNSIKNPVYVGDTQGDADECKAVGVPMIYAEYGLGEVENPGFKLADIRELIKIL